MRMRSLLLACFMMMMCLLLAAPANAGCLGGLFSGMRARREARQSAMASSYSSYQSYQFYSTGYAVFAVYYYGVQQGAVCAPCGQPAQVTPAPQSPVPGTSFYYNTTPRVLYSTPAQMSCADGSCSLRR